jgi:hypothetical protein
VTEENPWGTNGLTRWAGWEGTGGDSSCYPVLDVEYVHWYLFRTTRLRACGESGRGRHEGVESGDEEGQASHGVGLLVSWSLRCVSRTRSWRSLSTSISFRFLVKGPR